MLIKSIKKFMARAYYKHLILIRLFQSKEPFLVWQMGKVGSKTIVNSLRSAGIVGPVFHVHVLSDALINKGELKKRSKQKGHHAYYKNIYIRKYLLTAVSNYRWKIVSLVRDPVARNVSAFFQNLDLHVTTSNLNYDSLFDDIGRLQEKFIKDFDHNRPIVWFDKEINGILGVDVFSKPFPKKKGFMIYNGNTFDLLVLKLEHLDSCAPRAFEIFAGINNFTLQRSNIGGKKDYSSLYIKFIENLQLPESYLLQMYNCKFTKHFYSKEEIDEFHRKWNQQK